jgi:lysophospholipase L1-like esterase
MEEPAPTEEPEPEDETEESSPSEPAPEDGPEEEPTPIEPTPEDEPEEAVPAEPEAEEEPESPAPAEPEPAPHEGSRILYALGDSIASGYALPSPAAQRYSALLTAALSERDGAAWTERNFAVAGDTSTDLLNRLRSGTVTGLEEAEEITVCIGANNVLRPAVSFLMAYASALFEEDSGRTVSDAYDAFREEAEAGIETLKSDLVSVMAELRRANPTARVTFLTVYNPYRNMDIDIDLNGLPIPFSAMSDAFVTVVNETLRAAAPELGYGLAEVYDAFEQDKSGAPLVNADDASTLFADPHPTPAGHALIAEVLFSALR